MGLRGPRLIVSALLFFAALKSVTIKNMQAELVAKWLTRSRVATIAQRKEVVISEGGSPSLITLEPGILAVFRRLLLGWTP